MSLIELYHYLNTELTDPRSKDWMFITSPTQIVLITLSYLYFVLQCGPRYMKNRPAYKFKRFIRWYNIFQIVANSWLMYAMVEAGWYRDYFVYCVEEESYQTTPQAYAFVNIMWYVMCMKIIDYIETGLFVLRKKQNQISFLHLYHHVTTVLITWLSTKYFSSGMAMTIPFVNCGVHVIMYTYYLLSSFGPSVQKMIAPVKPMITITQMVQFVILITYSMQAYIPGCRGQRIIGGILIVDLVINFILFYNFYQKNYVQKQKQK